MPVVHHLYADQFGCHIGKYSERLKVTRQKQTLALAPLIHLQSVTVANLGVSISVDAIAACCERGIPIVMMDGRGHVYASLYASGLVGTVMTRREQLLAYTDWRGFAVGTSVSAAKLNNQAATLRYWARNRREADPAGARMLQQAAAEIAALANQILALEPQPIADIREAIMGLEGAAARAYWGAAALLIHDEYGFPGRVGRGAVDPVNSLLNYGYGILYAEIERAVILAGLDPYAGFLHADRPGKPSLVLDMIEEFRQMAVDRPVLGLVARRYVVTQDERHMLADATRRDFAARIVEHLGSQVRYEGQRVALRHAIQMQARHLATFVRGEREQYVTFSAEG